MINRDLALLWLCARYVKIDFAAPVTEKTFDAIQKSMDNVESALGFEELFKLVAELKDELEPSNVVLFRRKS